MNQKIILRSRPNQTVTQDHFQYIDANIAPINLLESGLLGKHLIRLS